MSSQIVNVEWKSKNFWQNKVSKIRASEIRVSEIRVSEIRQSEIRASEIRVSEIRISSNHRELHGAIFSCVNLLLKTNGWWWDIGLDWKGHESLITKNIWQTRSSTFHFQVPDVLTIAVFVLLGKHCLRAVHVDKQSNNKQKCRYLSW